ncbi:MAG: hypothetical protein EZS28_017712 [Streblomastix strix]|uniref:Uncharacterized protein n=1 Tax=Streblomastix strix TaxID=222440 RepID=A0A5J4VWR1_9EUKA|nr:MAG: hypothetical protein EZS28_017712 [Streblomastix strix]
MRTEIISHLMSIVGDSDAWTQIQSRVQLGNLAQNSENRSEIMKGIDMKSIAEELRKPYEGTLEQKKEIQNKQEGKCILLYAIIHGRNDDELGRTIINSGIVDSLFFIFNSRDLSSITIPFVDVIQQLTLGSNEVKLLLYSKKPYPYLLRLLNHSDNEKLEFAICSIVNIINAGSNATSSSSLHPHFDQMSTYGGIEKLYSLFKRTDINEVIKDSAAICIGQLFSAKQLPHSMRTEIISHLMSIVGDFNNFIKINSRIALGNLAKNSENRSEIMKGIDMKSIAEELRKPYIGTLEQKKEIQNKQEGKCNLLYAILNGRSDDELRKTIINSGIVDSLFFIFDTRDLSSITAPYVDVIQQLTLGNDEVRLLLYSKKPYPYLLRLLNHIDNIVLEFTICSIINILFAGSNTTSSSSLHPHFDQMSRYGGIEKLYSLFKRSDMNKKIKDLTAICIGRLFSARELPHSMRTNIISYLKTLINDSEIFIKIYSRIQLGNLAQNSVNKSEIEKGDFIIPQ